MHHIRIAEAQHMEACPSQNLRPMLIGCFPSGMTITVNFNDQLEVAA